LKLNLPGAKDVSAVAAVMSALSQREFHAAFSARFENVVAEPMVGHRAAHHVRHAPRMDATADVANQYSSIVPFLKQTNQNKIRTFHSNDFVLILKYFTWKWPEM
jgi:hypothetical protein